ncbi:MAG TPA: two-component regulator propeller domain-containing protein [Tepidisphaeraceae bacterium]|jgi:PAS domain S-box-containing protein|nr:two-component regulator propeller domain-containing protein [Tepidisphaeraceae bacterium]
MRYLAFFCGLLVVSSLAAKPPVRTDLSYLIDTWETEDGLPENSATAMVQDRAGYLWFGTFGGLVRFDGVSFTHFDTFNTPKLPSDGIVNLHLDRRGRLWISTTRGLVIRDQSGWRTVGGTLDDYVRTFSERSNGDLLLTTFDGSLLEWSKGQLRRLPPPTGKADNQGYFGHVDEKERWWAIRHDFVGTWDGQHWIPAADIGPGAIGYGDARDGGLWLLTGQILRKYRQGHEVQHFDLPESPGGFWSMSEDRDGDVWINTMDRGVCRVSPAGEFRRWNISNGLAASSSRFVFEDREGDLWVGTNGGGLQRFKPRRFQSIGLEEGLPERVVHSICPTPHGSLLIGTYGGGAVRYRDGKFEAIPLPGAIRIPAYVHSILADRAGRTWVGAFNDGLWLIEAGKSRHIPPELTGGANIVTLFEDSHGRVWINGGMGIAVYEKGEFHPFAEKSGAPLHAVRFTEDSRGIVWVADRSGLFALIDGRFIEMNENGRSIRNVNAIFGDSAGGLWIAPAHDDLLYYRGRNIARIDASAGIPVGDIRSIVEDNLGFLWMTSSQGIFRVRRDELVDYAEHKRGPLAVDVFDLQDGLPSVEFPVDTQPVCARDKNGRLWFATFKGIATIDPATLRLNRLPPPVEVETLVYHKTSPASASSTSATAEHGTEEVLLQGPFTLPPHLPAGSRWLEIHYAAMSMPAPSKVHYQVKLEPLDADWFDMGNQRTAYYYDPNPGNYIFRVRAANDDGVWNMDGASLALTVQPYFWQTGWFRFVSVLSLVLTGAAAAGWIAHLRHRRWREKHERAYMQSAALLKLSSSAAVSGGNLKQALAEITETTAKTLNVRQVSVSLMDETEKELRGADVFDRHRGIHIAGMNLSAGRFPQYFEVLRSGRTIDAVHARSDRRTRELAEPYLIPLGISSVLDASARAGGRVVGSVRFEHSGPVRTWRDDEIGFASAVADQIAQILLNAEKERAHRQMRESEERFLLMADAAPVMMWRSGADKLCDFFNKPWLEFTGRTMEQEVGNGWCEGVHADDLDRCLDTYANAFDARRPFQMEYRLRRADGEYRWVLDAGAPRTPDGRFTGYIGSCLDITERKQAEMEVLQQRSELAHLSRVTMLGELSGSLAHELNQPLTAILSNAQAAQRFMARENVDLDKLADILKDIIDEDRRAGQVIQRLRLLLRKGEVNQQPLDLNELVREVLRLVHSDLLNHDIVVETELEPNLPPVSGDRVQIQQVLINLVMNASDAMSANPSGERRITFRTQRLDDGTISTSVADAGCGIPTDRIDRIFEPFFTTKPHGMGMGLSVCRTIIAAHGGRLSASNNAERGATFQMSLQPAGGAP